MPRISKVLGYGLSDLSKDKHGNINDPRINLSSPLIDEDVFDDKFPKDSDSLVSYKKYLNNLTYETSLDKFILTDNDDYRAIPTRALEYSVGNVFLVTPLSFIKTWLRKDDTIDYFDSFDASLKEYPTPSLKIFDQGIFPFTNYIDSETGSAVVEDGGNNSDSFFAAYNANDMYNADLIAKRMGYSSAVELRARLIPSIPDDIINLVTWGEVFTDSKYILQLRPMLYTFWS